MRSCPCCCLVLREAQECAAAPSVQRGSLAELSVPDPPQALLHCPKLQQLRLSDCPALETLIIWSDDLKELDLTGGGELWVHSLSVW